MTWDTVQRFKKQSLVYCILVQVNPKDTPGKGARRARGIVEPNRVHGILQGNLKPLPAEIETGVLGEPIRKVGWKGEDGWRVSLSLGLGIELTQSLFGTQCP